MNDLRNKRYIWVDCIKIFACILVVLGHLYMSFASSGLISSDAVYYCLPIQTIYSFQVPLFFVCSGFLYQMKASEYTLKEHVGVIKSKALALGIPYFTFSAITLLLKTVFSSYVNNQATPFFKTLFLDPVAPYWYLYALFFIFCVTPHFRTQKSILFALVAALIVKTIFVCLPFDTSVLPYALKTVILNEVWFLFGMLLTTVKIKRNTIEKIIALTSFCIALTLSCVFYRENNTTKIIQFIIGSLFVISIVYFFIYFCNGIKNQSVLENIGELFMPVFLLHTICAATLRSILFKLCISSLMIHIPVGLIASFLLPVLIYLIAKKHWFTLFWFEPIKALKQKEKKNA